MRLSNRKMIPFIHNSWGITIEVAIPMITVGKLIVKENFSIKLSTWILYKEKYLMSEQDINLCECVIPLTHDHVKFIRNLRI